MVQHPNYEHPNYEIRDPGDANAHRCECGGIRYWHATTEGGGCEDCDCIQFHLAGSPHPGAMTQLEWDAQAAAVTAACLNAAANAIYHYSLTIDRGDGPNSSACFNAYSAAYDARIAAAIRAGAAKKAWEAQKARNL